MINVLRSFPLRSFAVLIAGLLLLSGCAATLPPRPDIAYGQGLLWQVDKDGMAPSYVFGTMHVPDPEILDLPAAVEDAFAKSDQAAFELVSDKGKEFEEARRFGRAATLPDGQSLLRLLDGATYAKLIRIAQRQQPRTVYVGNTHISNFKPWFVMLIVDKNDRSRSRLDGKLPILDDWLEARARKAGKVVVSLETLDEQLAVFDDIPMNDQIALLTAHLEGYNNWQSYRTEAELYLKGDTGMFYGIWQEYLDRLDPGLAKRFNDRFLNIRNHNMVERAQPLLAKGSTFIAVGALHLPGEEGVLRLLEQQGFTVTRLH